VHLVEQLPALFAHEFNRVDAAVENPREQISLELQIGQNLLVDYDFFLH
jgi:hypothetical protein